MKLERVSVHINKQVIVNDVSWDISPDQAWAVLGTNACGKSSLGKLLAGILSEFTGEFLQPFDKVIWLSLETQQELYEREIYRDDTDFMDQLDDGTPVKSLLEEITPWGDHCESICQRLKLAHILNRGYRALSTGEGRRVMLARALLAQPDYLILDEPFEGLDASSREDLHAVINALIEDGQALLLLVNQQADIADSVTHLALMDKGEFLFTGKRPEDLGTQWQHLLTLKRQDIKLPERRSEYQLPNWSQETPLVKLTDGFVQYDETYQFKQLNWSLMPGKHTHIAGPNGCGKSTLLGLVTGDHPQCYRNDLNVLGFKRGQGESIWQIKKHLGYVSGSLHRDYRVAGNVLTAVVSGLTDSIGVYQAIGDTEKQLAMNWLALIGMEEKWNLPFKQLSMGEQRLILIARALIKQPPLLILDEPTQGLDDFNRFYVLSIVERILEAGPTTLLFVSHRQDEVLSCIKNRLRFIPSGSEAVLFEIEQEKVN